MNPITKISFKKLHGNSNTCALYSHGRPSRFIVLRSNLPCRDDPGFDEVETYVKLLNHEHFHVLFCSWSDCVLCKRLDSWLDDKLAKDGITCMC
jgi:hypothetical protein